MENQHRQIKGYRELSEVEIALMNSIKEKAEEVRSLIDDLRGLEEIDMCWLSIGITDLQKGFMALTRAVAQPTSF